jgi:hypothetical protein
MDPVRDLCLPNSVAWYEAVFRTHGLEWAVADTVWACGGVPPPYYSRAISLAPEDPEKQIRILRGILSSCPTPFSVKDSFARLDLAPLGFRLLFAADWVRRDPIDAPAPRRTGLDWGPVTSPGELAAWEDAWRRNGSPAQSPVFLPALLEDGEVAVFAALRGDRIVAGCAGNRSGNAVGFSNFFAEEGDLDALVAEATGRVARFAPGLPIVGYESGESLERVLRHGFRIAGPLRVWTTEGS